MPSAAPVEARISFAVPCFVTGERRHAELHARLLLARFFTSIVRVSPAPDEVTSTTATGVSGHHGAVAFTTTHWSVVLEAQGESPAAQEALEKLCRTYWRPIFAFLRRQGLRPEEAEDITQGFFAELLERRSLDAVRKEKGRLRSFLLGGLKYFLANEQRRAMAIKRGKGQRLIPLEELRADERIEMEPADPLTAEHDLRASLGFDGAGARA